MPRTTSTVTAVVGPDAPGARAGGGSSAVVGTESGGELGVGGETGGAARAGVTGAKGEAEGVGARAFSPPLVYGGGGLGVRLLRFSIV